MLKAEVICMLWHVNASYSHLCFFSFSLFISLHTHKFAQLHHLTTLALLTIEIALHCCQMNFQNALHRFHMNFQILLSHKQWHLWLNRSHFQKIWRVASGYVQCVQSQKAIYRSTLNGVKTASHCCQMPPCLAQRFGGLMSTPACWQSLAWTLYMLATTAVWPLMLWQKWQNLPFLP